MGVFERRLARFVRSGNLTIIDAAGEAHPCGDRLGPELVVRFHDRNLALKILINPYLAAAEAYMDGRLTLEQGSLLDLLQTGFRLVEGPLPAPFSWLEALRRMAGAGRGGGNSLSRAQANVQRHYDADPRIYDLFLDRDKHYSCAYFASPGLSLEEAQAAKARLIAAKLRLSPGMKVLDIGSGWGALAFHLAAGAGVHVTGITLSENQHRQARAEAVKRGLEKQTDFRLADYRKIEGAFDRIVSVGMFEHVGVRFYPEFFAAVARLLKKEGVALIHTIGRLGPPGTSNSFMEKYIFPGGYIPALSEVAPAVERAGFYAADVEVWRSHYAETLRVWRERFMARYDRAAGIAGEKFCRMWEFYLTGSEVLFRLSLMGVFQFQLAREMDALPVTRSYMTAAPAAGLKDSAQAAQ